MANLKLGSSDVKQLLANYEGRQRQLQFELDHTKNMIRNLKAALPIIEQTEAEQAASLVDLETDTQMLSVEVAQPTAKRRGRPKNENSDEAKPKKEAKEKPVKEAKERSSGYRLSEYDELVFKALRETDHALINSQLVGFIHQDKAAQGANVSEDEVQTMVVRSLQKLANRREDIKKVPYEGRGMAYALPEWLNGQGVIKKKHAHRE